MNKFKKNDRVNFKGDTKIYLIVRAYKSRNTYKYDLASLNGKETVIAMPQATLEKAKK